LKYLLLETPPWPEPQTSAVLAPSPELVEQLVKGKEFTPEFSPSFPAQTLTTKQTWKELILEKELMEQIKEIKIWIEYGDKVLSQWGLDSRMKPGYKCLFYGPSGTGKTFTTLLLGKDTGRTVFRVDLSMVVSKYIGETEKNLSRIFDAAERMNVILFFDEADALFGKRTQVKDAHDRYANLETSYLLQRIEDFNGLVILASNLKSNIDDAFARRFQTVIHFTIPNPEQRRVIWKNTFSHETTLEKTINLEEIAEKYELSGGSILNVVRYCSVMAMSRNSKIIKYNDLINGIKKEFQKEGKTI
jgi:SpoVK/Ycf46/Vps4 family AAA+-type ATPase